MKKLMISAAIAIASLSTFSATAQVPETPAETASVQEEYIEVKNEEVPEAITKALKKAYPEAILDKAYTNANKEYKLDVTVGDSKGNLFADANGKWIQK
jgi:hypothetical protein